MDVTKLRNFTIVEIRECSAFQFSLQLMFDQTLSNVIVFFYFIINIYSSCTSELAYCSGYLAGLNFIKLILDETCKKIELKRHL